MIIVTVLFITLIGLSVLILSLVNSVDRIMWDKTDFIILATITCLSVIVAIKLLSEVAKWHVTY
jgi:hypothetical protein